MIFVGNCLTNEQGFRSTRWIYQLHGLGGDPDLFTMRRIVNNLLREGRVGRVAEAEDGTEALRKLDHDNVHFVVSDWNMPRMTGIELLKAVRSSENL